MDYIQTELNLGVVSVSGSTHYLRSSQYDPTWDEIEPASESTCKSVGEQVKEDTKKTAPQHDTQFNHWIEKYWVERASTKYWYYRYMWMEGRKLRRKYLGSVTSARAKEKKRMVEEYIKDGLCPSEIISLVLQTNC